MLHRLPEHNDYERRMQDTELAFLESSAAAQRAMAENYTGLPY
jgi:p-hydroxybenzoate 3-monooxygenase